MSERLTQQQIIDSALIGNLDNEIYNDGVDNYIKLKVNNTEYILKLTNPTPTPTMTPTITPTRTPTPTPTVTPSAAAPSEFGLPSSITIAGAVGGSISVNGTYSKTNQAIGYLAASTNGSFNYYNASTGVYVTSPDNTNSNGDYNYDGWVIASSADGAYYFMTNPSTDKFNFPTTGWVYSEVFGGSNSAGQSGSASLTITAA